MDDRKPGSKLAPEQSAMGVGWSLSQSLDGALWRAKPKASLGRHLVGYRVATLDEDGADAGAIDAAADDPDARAAIARAAQSGEAAWAHERIALIGRALDAEAQRLAADPQKAGKVAEHLAPLIEKAFAGAEAEAPGDTARAIVGREREPLETELLAERAVMSVAATQRAEREGRRAAFADELAQLKEQPQRWAAAHARQGRAIDDLPLDDTKKSALKGAAARAQANAAAEGLLQQDAGWLLEDLDDPEFAGALGQDDAARWRSAAEEAVARRAERVAAENAERALLAATDMRATLKRFKDKDDGPLPSRAAIAAALGSEAAADEMLSATSKGRKHRYAESAVALMPAADEDAWLDAAPDKEARTIRELAVATKRAAVAGNPGRWLMQHSATLRNLAKDATDDPSNLQRLVDHYEALRNRVRGHAAGDVGTDEAPAGADAPTDDAPNDLTLDEDASLPDEVAADLVEQVLAGETPQARLESLTKILDGTMDSASDDADDRARADAIAKQLEALGLPDGTAMRRAQLSDPRTRRSARIALLGGFAEQIAEEGKLLSGEGEKPEILGEEGDDTLTLENIRQGIRIPRGAGPATELMLNYAVRERIRDLVESEAISEEEANKFLADEGLNVLTEIELSEETARQLYSADNNEVVAALSEFADVVLLGAEKLAELEEKYGTLAEVALLGAQWIVGGPIKAAITFIVNRGVDAVLEEVGDDIFDNVIDFAGRQVTEHFGVAEEDAQKIAAATMFGLLAATGVASSAVDTFKFARHIVRRFRLKREWTQKGVSLASVPFLENRPLSRATMELRVAMHDGERWSDALRRFFKQDRRLRRFSTEEREALIKFFTRGVYPKTLEALNDREFSRLGRSEGFIVLRQYWIRLGRGEGAAKPDHVFLDRRLNASELSHEIDEMLEMVTNGDMMLGDSKGPQVSFSSQQMKVVDDLAEVGREDSFLPFSLPHSEMPPELMRDFAGSVLRWGNFRHIEPQHAYLVIDRLQKHFHPEVPVGRLLLTAGAILAAVDTILSENESDN